ncbi:MAG: tetratricopeptide repeat protein, partial [Candidatus Firestonebacteria bacterium]|nr:tetratricopeptide repeat protein [Candidatus Firestonebacteria bacterium]
MPKKRLGYLPLVCWLVLLPLAGCNLFTDLHHNGVDSDASVLTADGKSALARGDYNNAIVYFQRALDHDAGSSEARVGLAEAMVKAKQFNLAAFIQTLSNGSQTNGSSNIPGMPNVPQLLKLSDWNCATYAELEQLF